MMETVRATPTLPAPSMCFDAAGSILQRRYDVQVGQDEEHEGDVKEHEEDPEERLVLADLPHAESVSKRRKDAASGRRVAASAGTTAPGERRITAIRHTIPTRSARMAR